MHSGKRLYLAVLAILFVCGCGVVSPLRNGTTTPTPSSGGQLYVSTGSSILRFSGALAANGNVGPSVVISGSSSQLSSAQRLLLDVSTDRLFVANKGASSVLIFSSASKATAGSSPTAVLTASGMVSPFSIALDSSANLLYVADSSNNSILVFTNQSGLSGNVNTPPARTLTVNFNIGPIFLDSSNNLFIADPNDNLVEILQNASNQLSGNITILPNVGGAATNLSSPNGMVLDGGGRLIVSNSGSSPSVLVFTNLVIPSGANTAPTATISGSSTNIGLPGQMVFNGSANNGELYVADNQAPGILVFTNVNTATGNITSAPARTILGSATDLNANAVNGLALDTTR